MLEIWHYFSTVGPFQLIGILGFLVYALVFSWVQLDWLDGNSAKYSLYNILAASLVAISLFTEFNLSAALIQGSWILIGLFVLVKRLRDKATYSSKTIASVSSREMV